MLDASGVSCSSCHSVGGASDTVVSGTRLIKKDARMVQILQNWSSGQLPCVYCHDDTPESLRENMVGVRDHFSAASISMHPVDPFAPSTGDAGELDCTDCHTNTTYVGGGNTINPNIHGQDVQAVTFSANTGLLPLDATFRSYTGSSVSPYNADNNSFCTQQCHDPSHTGYAAGSVAHGITSSSLSLDLDSGFSSTVTGCLDEGGATGCHATHNADDNIGILTIQKNGKPVSRSDCGVCHTFDDGGGASDWSLHGHGKLQSTSDIRCVTCHVIAAPHFDVNGEPPAANPMRLSFGVDYGQSSSLTGLPTFANCVSSNCHAGYSSHSTKNVGCVDCHDPHGAGVSPNLKMLRRTIPGGAAVMQYTTTGQYWDSSTGPGSYSNWLCDNQDCHGGPTGPGPISSLMDTSPANTSPHSGGTGILGNCEACHNHEPTGATGSFGGGECFDCHGTQGIGFYPDGGVQNGPDYPNRPGKHAKHVAAIANVNGLSANSADTCSWCHPGGKHTGNHEPAPADLYDGTTNHFRRIDGLGDSDESVFQDGVSQVSCSGIDCHYNNSVAAGEWYGTPAAGCDYCHTDGSPYATGDLGLAHDLHVEQIASGGYGFGCTACHGGAAGYGNAHQDGGAAGDIVFTGFAATWAGAVYDSTNRQCSGLYCHGAAPPQPARWDSAGSVSCGTCHGEGSGRPDAPAAGGGHLTGTGTDSHSQVSCGTCHTHNGGPAGGQHVNGPANISGDALVSIGGSQITSFTYGSHLGTDTDGYEYSQNSCTPTCHSTGAWGGTGGCNFCHGNQAAVTYWPDGTTTHSSNDQPGEHAAHISALQIEAGLTTSDAGQKAMCAYCHPDPASAAFTTNHNNGTVQVSGYFHPVWASYVYPFTGTDDGAYAASTGTCSSVDCHDNKSTSPSADWYDAASAACVMCHEDPTSIATASGEVHVNHADSATYGIAVICADCHDDAVDWGSGTPPSAGHRDGAWTLDLTYSATWPAGSGQCTTTVCHSDGRGNAVQSPAWGTTTADPSCALCHEGVVMATNRHAVHLTSNALPAVDSLTECVACHDTTATAGGLASGSAHINDTVDLSFESTYDYENLTAQRNGAATGGTTTCSNVRCHNGVLTPQWSQTITCGQCHGDAAGTNPLPAWQGSVARSHGAHADTDSDYTDCADRCHTGADSYTSGGPSGTNHQNLTVDIFPSGAGTYNETDGSAGVNWTASDYLDDGTCSVSACHGTGTPQWGNPVGVTCESCHGVTGTAAENNNWSWDGTMATLNLSEYSNAGHGSTNGGATGGTPVECLDCHSEAVPHNSGSNPFRLDTSTYAANDINGFCGDTSAGCHAAFGAIQNHDSTVITNDKRTWHITPKCVDCHDPHGDDNNRGASGGTDNAKFMHDDLFDGGSNQYGIPAAQDTDYAGFDDTEAIGADDWAEGVVDGRDGLCQECHVNTVAFEDDTSDNIIPHSAATGCATCHKHSAGFEASGCDQCHGTLNNNYYPDTDSADKAVYEDREGAHYEHVLAIANVNGSVNSNDGTSCDFCHPNPGGARPGITESHSDDSQADSTADVHGDGRPGATATIFKTMSGGSDPDGAYSPSIWTCTNVDCHTNVDTPDWYGLLGPTFAPITYDVRADSSTTLSIQRSGSFTLTATADDTGGGNHSITAVEYFLDTVGTGGTGTAMSASDGSFNSATEGATVSVSTTGWTLGEHWLYVHGRDGTDGWGGTAAVKVTVYDADTVTLAATSVAPANITQGARDAFLKLDFTVNTNGDSQAVIDQVRIDRAGTAADGDVFQVAIYDDDGGSAGVWDTTGDSLLGAGAFSGGQAIIDIVDQMVANGSTTTLHTVLTLSGTADTNTTIGATVDDAYVTLVGPDTMAAATPVTSTLSAIDPAVSPSADRQYYLVRPTATTALWSSGNTTIPNTCGSIYNVGSSATLPPPARGLLSLTGVNCGTASDSNYAQDNNSNTGWLYHPGFYTDFTFTEDTLVEGHATNQAAIAVRANATSDTLRIYFAAVDSSGNHTLSTNFWEGTNLNTGFAPVAMSVDMSGVSVTVPAGSRFALVFQWNEGSTTTTRYRTFFDNVGVGPFFFWVTETAGSGGAGTTPPTATSVRVNGSAATTVTQGTPVTLTAAVSDADGNTITAAEYFLDTVGSSGSGVAMAASDGNYNSANEPVRSSPALTTGSWSAGQHKLYVHGQDGTDGWGPTSYAVVNITVPGTMTVTGTDLVPAEVDQGSTVAMLQLDAVMDTGTTSATAFTVDLIGTGTVSDISQVYIYLDDGDDNFDSGVDTAIGSAAFTVDPVGVTVSPTQVDTGGKSFFVVYAVDGSATGGNTVGANVTGIAIDADDSVSGLPTSSGTTSIKLSGGISCGDCHAVPNASGAHARHANSDTTYTDCHSCHTDNSGLSYSTTPAGTHNNGSVTMAGSVSYTGGTNGTCNTSCHFGASPNWSSGTANCDTCHGYPPDGTKAMNHLAANRTRSPQSGSSTDDGFFNVHTQCDVCHGVSGNTDWDVAGTDAFGTPVDQTPDGDAYVTGPGGMHGDGVLQMNGAGGDNPPLDDKNTDYRANTLGCVKACHTEPHDEWRFSAGSSQTIELREFGAGGACDACHGGTAGTDQNGYWPDAGARGDADSGGSADNIGAHLVHIRSLAMAAWGETITPLLTDNGNGTADSKQRALCRYCHPSRTTDTTGSGDHFAGDNAETAIGNGDYSWTGEFPFIDGTDVNDNGDFGDYTGYTCASVDCHNNVTTPSWYSAAAANPCAVCHSGITTHLKLTSGGADQACTACHPGGATNPNKHMATGNPAVVTIPLPPTGWDNPATAAADNWDMRARLGIDYTTFGGIHLGGESTSGSTEADICWNCHTAASMDGEWGPNTDTNGASWPIANIRAWAGSSYNYGTVYTDSGWTPGNETHAWVDATNSRGYWRKDAYKHDTGSEPDYILSQRISSVHSVDFTIGSTPGSSVAMNVAGDGTVKRGDSGGTQQYLESRSQIRCSYCHDVHNLNKADGTAGGQGWADGSSSAPYLRGSWVGNPYGPDIPPTTGMSWQITSGGNANHGNQHYSADGSGSSFGQGVPRLYADASYEVGGYMIDQNTGYPTEDGTMNSLQLTAGLCALCHGTSVDTMDYWNGSSIWRTATTTVPNGHINSTLGGSGTDGTRERNNLFDARRGATSPVMAAQEGVNVTSYGKNYAIQTNGPFRNIFASAQPAGSTGVDAPPRNTAWYGGTNGATTRGGQYSTWYGTGIGVRYQSNGTTVTTQAHTFTCSKCHSPHATGLPALLITNCLDKQTATWLATASQSGNSAGPGTTNTYGLAAQNNCHRKDDSTRASGWHYLAPAQ